ncbi:Histone-lysine N-methyltransferase, H3 lysine-36 and H4 lysine-20 specific [Gracilariopsis chorda]|uniref:Histone-lysine N-methyltransferase, H3 lysine-36 and H4 lysine-20 specific n=1 Tax=Gracilariopsis chorda TaxID=448386 RepID=A0A2V3IT40_9FLOR|nr:Histone-lysine N-methyltransferase, H3 lysine-36 and H4 lysine-20 specific [Gracilariopsis chorda]|eukprot:PXF45272.1 Histone-lysine N-methyltransferase, H3 lysine-36 and H4 lysine-20 specific [Gracilariopsis chorda]
MFRKLVPWIVPMHEIASVTDEPISPNPPAAPALPLRKNKRLRAAAAAAAAAAGSQQMQHNSHPLVSRRVSSAPLSSSPSPSPPPPNARPKRPVKKLRRAVSDAVVVSPSPPVTAAATPADVPAPVENPKPSLQLLATAAVATPAAPQPYSATLLPQQPPPAAPPVSPPPPPLLQIPAPLSTVPPPARTPTRAAAKAAALAVAASAASVRAVSTAVTPATQQPCAIAQQKQHPLPAVNNTFRDADKARAQKAARPKPRDKYKDKTRISKQHPSAPHSQQLVSNKSATPDSGDSLDSSTMGANNDLSTEALMKIVAAATQHRIVWTKIKGHPYWPAQCVPMTPELEQQQRFKHASKFRRRFEDTCVMYFGTCEVAYVNMRKSCISWEEGVRKSMHLTLKGRAVFQRALSEVKAFCHRVQRFPRGWWNEPDIFVLYNQFYDECLNSNLNMRLREFIRRAESELIFWAKIRGFPPWPVQVLPRNMAAERYPQLKLSPDSSSTTNTMPCMFFGTGEVALINEKNFAPFGAGLTRGYVVSSDRHDFCVALGELWGYLQDPRIWPSGYLSKQPWWNYEDMVSAPSPSDSGDFFVPHLPHYEHIKKSVWGDGIEPPQKPRRSDVACCDCKPSDHGEPSCTDSACLNFASRFLCNPVTCRGGPRCANTGFHNRKLPLLRPFFTADQRGWGLRVEEAIKKGSFVIEYIGEIIDRDTLERRLGEAQKQGSHEYYIMDLTNDLFVDAKFKGNLSRFINSSCDPNCATQKWTDSITGQTHVGIFAKQDIPAGTELTYNYCFEDFGLLGKSQKRSFMCQCGTSSCCMLDPEEKKQMKLLIGKRLEVRWDDGWYPGVVESYSLKKKRFRVQYDDGDCEDLTLGLKTVTDDNVKFRLIHPPSEDSGEHSKSSRGSRKSKEAD